MKKLLFIIAAILLSWQFPFITSIPQAAQALPENTIIEDFELLNQEYAWLLASHGLYVSEDGGHSWLQVTPQINKGQKISAVDFVDHQQGWSVLIEPDANGDAIYNLAQTDDGGLSWQSTQLDLFTPGDTAGSPSAVHLQFLDKHTGWLSTKSMSSSNFSKGSLFWTEDGGTTWVERTIPIGDRPFFISDQDGWVAGGPAGDEIYSTDNGGGSWTFLELGEIETLEPDSVRYQVPVFSPSDGENGTPNALLPVIVTYQGRSQILLFESQNQGTSWERVQQIDTGSDLSGAGSLPMANIGVNRWMLVNPSNGSFWVVDGDHLSLYYESQSSSLKGVQKIMTANPGPVWATYWKGQCNAEGCLKQNGLINFESQSGDVQHLYMNAIPMQPPVKHNSSSPDEPSKLESMQALNLTKIHTEGQAFDKCDMATVEQHEDWKLNGPYISSNLYIGGIARACKTQAAMTKENLRTLSETGWTFIPTWVGPQAPCSSYNYKIPSNTSQALQQGKDEADAAVEAAFNLGLTKPDKGGTVIYYDMEPFDTENAACLNAVKSFFNGWDSQLKSWNNVPGVYSRGYEINTLAGISHPPEVIWPANWYCPTYPDCSVYEYREDAHVWNVSGLPNSLWDDHQRIRQYAGGHNETWGATTLKIDSNVMDGLVADISKSYLVSVLLDGHGLGTVASSPGGIDCGNTCEFVFEKGISVTLQATPAVGSIFFGWEGVCEGFADSCQITMDQAHQVTAKFYPVNYNFLPLLQRD